MTTGAGSSGRGGGDNLQTAVASWPTPTANDFKGSGPTLLRQDGKMRGDRLDYAAEQCWPTPTSLSFADSHQPGNSYSYNKTMALAERIWSTPSVADVMGGRMARSKDRADELLLNGQAAYLSSHQDPPSSSTGETSSNSGRKLNPLFVEWLMGWPTGWTAFECSATELSRFKQRMRSELSQLVSVPAPPAQLSLFG